MSEMNFSLKHKGGQYYHATDGNSITLTKKQLGDFVYHIMMNNGEIIQLWNQFGAVRGSSVSAVIAMLPADKAKFEQESGFTLAEPAKIHLN